MNAAGTRHGVDVDGLHQRWTADARAAGLAIDRLDRRFLTEDVGIAPARTDEALIERALRTVTQESATWLRADLARHIAQQLDSRTGGSGVDLVAEVDRLAALADGQCVPLAPERNDTPRHRADGRPITEHVTDRRLVTPDALQQELALQGWAYAAIEPVRRTDDPQAEAARAMAGTGRLVLVVGPAGTGKTRATAQAVARLRREGRPVIGLAPSGKAADVLAGEAGCRTDTLAGFLTRHRGRDRHSPWPAGTTVVLDEAGMAATSDLASLLTLAHRNQWRVAAVGDPEQLPAVGRGGVFAQWCDTLPHHTLDTPRRFTESWEAQASLGLRGGRPGAVAAYERHGRLSTAHPSLVPNQVARWHQRQVDSGRTVAITTNSAETARAINREIQRIADFRRRRPAELRDGTHVGVGDRIATRRNHPDLRTDRDERVRNRHTWTVTATQTDGALTVEHPDRGIAELPARYVAEHVELGWAVTGYGNQGDTVDAGIAILEPGTSRNQAYVATTRGRDRNDAIVLDPTGTTDASERLAEIITRPANAESALAVQARLHRLAGIDLPDSVAQMIDPDRTAKPEPKNPSVTLLAELHDKYKPVRPREQEPPYRPPPRRTEPGIGIGR